MHVYTNILIFGYFKYGTYLVMAIFFKLYTMFKGSEITRLFYQGFI